MQVRICIIEGFLKTFYPTQKLVMLTLTYINVLSPEH